MRLSRPGAQDDMGQMSLWGVDHRGPGLKRSETLPKCPGSDRHPAASPHLAASVGAAWASVVMGSSLISASQFLILSSGTVTTHHHTAAAHLHIAMSQPSQGLLQSLRGGMHTILSPALCPRKRPFARETRGSAHAALTHSKPPAGL